MVLRIASGNIRTEMSEMKREKDREMKRRRKKHKVDVTVVVHIKNERLAAGIATVAQ